MLSEWKRRSRHDRPRLADHSCLVRMEAGIGIWMTRDTSALETFKAARVIGTDMFQLLNNRVNWKGWSKTREVTLELWLQTLSGAGLDLPSASADTVVWVGRPLLLDHGEAMTPLVSQKHL